MKTLQEHYNAIKTGQGNKAQFVKQARNLFPEYFNQYTNYDNAVSVLKSKQIISEAAGGVVSKGFDIWDWKKILEAKAVETETSKEVLDDQKNAYNNKDMKNADNVNFNEIMKGFYCEMKDPANKDKTGDELKAMVVKNLAKDPLYYTKDGMFGEKGVGFTDEAPGLGKNTQPTSKVASVLGGRDEVDSNSDIVKNSLVGTTKKVKLKENKEKRELSLQLVDKKDKKGLALYKDTENQNNLYYYDGKVLYSVRDDGSKGSSVRMSLFNITGLKENKEELNEDSISFSILNSDFSEDIYIDRNKVYISPKLAQSLESSFFSRGPASYERTKSNLDKAKTTYIKIDPSFRGILRKGLKGANITELPKKNSDGTFKWVALNFPKKDYDIKITDEKITINKKQPVAESKISEGIEEYDDMSDQEIINWAEENGMEELIVLDGEGGLANREEVLRAILGIEDLGSEESEEEMWGPGDIDPAGGYGPSSHMESVAEQKLRSLIRNIIKEEISETILESEETKIGTYTSLKGNSYALYKDDENNKYIKVNNTTIDITPNKSKDEIQKEIDETPNIKLKTYDYWEDKYGIFSKK